MCKRIVILKIIKKGTHFIGWPIYSLKHILHSPTMGRNMSQKTARTLALIFTEWGLRHRQWISLFLWSNPKFPFQILFCTPCLLPLPPTLSYSITHTPNLSPEISLSFFKFNILTLDKMLWYSKNENTEFRTFFFVNFIGCTVSTYMKKTKKTKKKLS